MSWSADIDNADAGVAGEVTTEAGDEDLEAAGVEWLTPTCISDWEHWLQLNFLPAKR